MKGRLNIADLAFLDFVEATADRYADGHLTILKTGGKWRVGFSMPTGRKGIEAMAVGKTLREAASRALTKFTAEDRAAKATQRAPRKRARA